MLLITRDVQHERSVRDYTLKLTSATQARHERGMREGKGEKTREMNVSGLS